MHISKTRALWPESKDFIFSKTDRCGEYVFIHFHTPVLLHLKGEDILTKEGAVILFDRFATRNFEANDIPLLHDWIHISSDSLSDLLHACNIEPGTVYYPCNTAFITESVQELELEWLNPGLFSEEISETVIKKMFFRLSRELKTSPEHTVNESLRQLLTEARSKIHKSYSEKWEISQMAELIHLSPSYFYKVYKKAFGVSPKKDLQQVRIEHAKQLLIQKNLSVRETADRIGYENEYYFIRKFKETTGTTPGKYK